jgi:hypothetical protein
MKQQMEDYSKSEHLGSGKDMAHHKYDAYKVDDEIHIVYENGHVATKNIQIVKDNMDEHLWTPFVEWV